jgi:hypothetical protein
MANNPNAAKNLKPFTGADDPRRQNGAPKGTKHLKTWIREAAEDKKLEGLVFSSKGEFKDLVKTKQYPVKALVAVAFQKALAGDKQWADWIANNGWKQEIDITSDGEKLEAAQIYLPSRND